MPIQTQSLKRGLEDQCDDAIRKKSLSREEERTYYPNDRTTLPREESQGDRTAPPREESQGDHTTPIREGTYFLDTAYTASDFGVKYYRLCRCHDASEKNSEAVNNSSQILKHGLEGNEDNKGMKGKVTRNTCANGNNIFTKNYYDNDRVIIDDVEDLYFQDGDPTNDYKIKEINVSQMFRKYQNESVRMSKNGGLFVESNVHEIFSLSSIFLLYEILIQTKWS
ncbi:10432_t:CDS:2, partial [Racocetra persica]